LAAALGELGQDEKIIGSQKFTVAPPRGATRPRSMERAPRPKLHRTVILDKREARRSGTDA